MSAQPRLASRRHVTAFECGEWNRSEVDACFELSEQPGDWRPALVEHREFEVRRGDPDPSCQVKLTSPRVSSKIDNMTETEIGYSVRSNDPAKGLRASQALHGLGERVEARYVALAREQSWSWQQIGDALGLTRQSVHLKYGKDVR
jgi:hypothetical protein